LVVPCRPPFAVPLPQSKIRQHITSNHPADYVGSHKTNMRTDEYAATPTGALRLLERIVSSIRSEVAKEFIVGVKINSADYLNEKGGDSADLGSETRALEHVRTIASWGQVDFIEISGGDYDDPCTASLAFSPRVAFYYGDT
jgi:2,4-dienoyl-CoA reductase-like NADH-dependent reductase (Old Yellow Enzyme family)